MRNRLLAIVAAVAMIAGALVIRHHRDQRAATDTSKLRLVCATELATLCDALAGVAETSVEPEATTFDRLANLPPGSPPGLDGWLTIGEWPSVMDNGRESAGRGSRVFHNYRGLGGSPITMAIYPDRADVLRAKCGSEIAWKCLGDAAAAKTWSALGGPAQWGPIKIGLPDPATSGAGPTVVAGATAGYFNRSALATADLEDDRYGDWLSGLAHGVEPHQSLQTMLSAGAAVLDAYLSTEAEIRPAVAASARQPKPVLIYPAPMAYANIEVSTVGGRGSALDRLFEGGGRGITTLRSEGWGNSQPAAAELLPALRNAWLEAAR